MTWTKLLQMPRQKLRNPHPSAITFWEIVDGKVVHQGRPNRNARVESFECLDGSSFIARDDRFLYHAWTTHKTIDPASFAALGDGYYADKDQILFEFETSLKPLKGETTEGFAVIGDGFARDRVFAYYFGRPIRSCTSPMTFKLVRSADEPVDAFAMDAERVFCEGAELKGADPTTWRRLGRGFSMDATSVYFLSKKLGGARPENWRMLTHPYSTNGTKIYNMAWALIGADVDSFEVLPDGSCRDKHSAFIGKHRAQQG